MLAEGYFYPFNVFPHRPPPFLFRSLGICSLTVRWNLNFSLSLDWVTGEFCVAFSKVGGSGALRLPGEQEGGCDAWAPGAVTFTSVRD